MLPIRLGRYSIRRYSISRAPGRIFGNYEQNQSNDISGTASSHEGPINSESRRFSGSDQSQSPSSTNSSSIVFPEEEYQDYSLSSFEKASESVFSQEISDILAEPIDEQLIEIKPDGSCYLPEVHYRRLLSKSFGIAGWALIPRGPHSIQGNVISREYALFAKGKFISQAWIISKSSNVH